MKDVAVRTFLAVLVAVCIAIALTEPARGDRSSGTTRGMGVGQAAAVLSLDTFNTAPATYRPGYVKVPSPHHRSAISPAVAVPTAAAVAAKLRGFVHTMEASKKPRLIQRASSLRLWIAIVEAKTPAEYHEAVRKLPVTITYSTTSDGRQVRHYEVEGKIRFEATGPTSQSVFLPVLQDVAGVPSGPFVPVQSSECYLEEEEPCQTAQEEEDWEIEIAYAEYETDVAEVDANDAQAHWDLYCQTYPYDPGCVQFRGLSPSEVGSGPSASPSAPSDELSCPVSCASEAMNATTGIFASTVAFLTAKGKLADAKLVGKALSVASVAAARLTMVGAVAVAGFTTGYFLACVVDTYIFQTGDVAGSAAQARAAKPEPLFVLRPGLSRPLCYLL